MLVSVEGASGFRDPALRDTPPADDQGHPVVVEDAEGCPVFVARTVSGFDPTAPTPDFMVRRITAAGMRPISLAVDVTNYVMLETGRPIHAYDADKVRGAIVVRRARDGERLRTLDGTDRVLDPADLVVTDDSGTIGLGGVMGGETTEISDATTTVLVEAAHWDAVSMYRTGRRHKITSEAGKRNERGVDPTICEAAADRVVELLAEHGGGRADPGVTVVGTPPAMPVVEVPGDLAERVSGMAISEERSIECLRAIGCDVQGAGTLSVTPPPWRPDLRDAQDFSEEVIRLVGYDLVPSVLPTPPSGRGLTRSQQLRRRVGRTLAGEGFVEVVTFPFVGEADLDALGLTAEDPRRDLLRLSNPLSAEAGFMTTTLLPGVLRAAGKNVGHGNTDLAIFETGTVTLPRHSGPAAILPVDRRPTDDEFAALDAALPAQPLHLAVVAAGDAVAGGWWGEARPVAWSDAVEAVRSVAAALGLEVTAAAVELAPWHPGRCAELSVVPGGHRRGGGDRARRRGAPDRVPRLRPARAHRGRGGRPRPAHRARGAPAPGAHLLVVPGREGGRRARRGRLGAGRRRRGRAPRGRRGAARVDPALRRLHRRPGRRGQEVPGLRPALPRGRPDPQGGRGVRGTRRRGRPRRRADRRRPALTALS